MILIVRLQSLFAIINSLFNLINNYNCLFNLQNKKKKQRKKRQRQKQKKSRKIRQLSFAFPSSTTTNTPHRLLQFLNSPMFNAQYIIIYIYINILSNVICLLFLAHTQTETVPLYKYAIIAILSNISFQSYHLSGVVHHSLFLVIV